MYSRNLNIPEGKSFFLFGPRGVGKSTWLRSTFKDALFFDLLDSDLLYRLQAAPSRLEQQIPEGFKDWIVLDEVQRCPELLNEVHRLIEKRRYKFILTGSSARSLKRKGVNLLAGRALTVGMFPLTSIELKKDFSLEKYLKYGGLPSVYQEADPRAYLASYVQTYLREEIQQEGLTRNMGAFSRFLEASSFSHSEVLNISSVSRDCSVERKVVEAYFQILEDLMLAVRLPVFKRKAKRKIVSHPKFFFFDTGIYQTLRPKGPLDLQSEIDGHALEGMVFQELRAINAYCNLGYEISYWRSQNGDEVDFVLYGERGFKAIEVKLTQKLRDADLDGLRSFSIDYPSADRYLVYTGAARSSVENITVTPIVEFLSSLLKIL